MSAEARDALAVAPEHEAIKKAFSRFHGDLRLADKDALATAFREVLAEDGWVLARREDAEDGAVVEEAAIAKALTYLRRQVEFMGEDGECSVRRIGGREYVTKDDVLLLVDERLGFALFITDTAAARKAKEALR